MARSLGSLVVSLGLNAVQFVTGLNKAELQAQQFARKVNTAMLEVGKTIATLEIGRQFVEGFKDVITAAGALDDLAGSTGSTVESLSRLSNQAQIAGADFGELQSVLLKLSVAIAGAGEEGSKAGAAMKLLGVTSKDPATALQQLAVGLDKFADGANKAGLVAAILGGKIGPQFLATLKDIAQAQDVVATTTTKQAEEAKALEKAWARLSVESVTFKNAVLNNMVPPLLTLITTFNDARRGGATFFEALRAMAQSPPWEEQAEAIQRLEKELADLEKTASDPGFELFGQTFAKGASVNILANIETVKKALTSLRAQQLAAFGGPPTNEGGKPPAPAPPSDTDANVRKKTLEKQLHDLDNFVKSEQETLTDRERVLSQYYADDLIGLREFFEGRRNALDEANTKAVAALTQEAAVLKAFADKAKPTDRIEAETKLADVLAKRARLQQDVAQKSIEIWLDETKAVKALKDAVEQTSIALAEMRGDTVTAAASAFDFANRKMKAQLAELAKSSNPDDQRLAGIGQADLEAMRELTIQRAALNKATETYSMTLDELGIATAHIANLEAVNAISATEAFARRQEITAAYVAKLKEELAVVEELIAANGRREDIIKAAKLRLELENITTDALKRQMQAMQDFQNMMADSFANSFEDFIMGTKSASQAFKDFANDIERYLLKIALHKLGDQLFGGTTSGGSDVFGSIFGAIMKMFSSPTSAGFGTGPFTFPAAAGGTSFAYGGPMMVGEHGPEVMDVPRGARVYPTGTGPTRPGGESAMRIENHFHVTGTINSGTVRQIERGVGDSVARNRIDR